MKTIRTILIISILSLCCSQLFAQNDKLNQLEEKTHIAYINSSVFMWKQIVQEADKLVDFKSASMEQKVSFIKLKYALLYACLSNKDQDTYDAYLENTLSELEILLKENPESSELHTILAAIMSVQMGFSPMKGMTLGSQSETHISKAISLDSLNPEAWRQHANSKYFTPKMFGGDINIAIKSYENSIRLFEKFNRVNDWMYLDALAWLGIAYQKNNQLEKSKEIFEKALALEPNFYWIKNQLLPNLLKS